MPVKKKFLGAGLKFPFSISPGGASKSGLDISDEEQHVNESIFQILATRLGERVMRRDFGSRLQEIPFEPTDDATISLIKHFVIDSLRKWERRVEVNDIDIEVRPKEGRIEVKLSIRYIKTNRVGNFVYPFFLAGGAVSV